MRGLVAAQLYSWERCRKINGVWHNEDSPLTQPLLSPQILPQSLWFQTSSSWPDSLTTWLSSRTDNPPLPHSFFWCMEGEHKFEETFFCFQQRPTPQKNTHRMNSASSSQRPANLHRLLNTCWFIHMFILQI